MVDRPTASRFVHFNCDWCATRSCIYPTDHRQGQIHVSEFTLAPFYLSGSEGSLVVWLWGRWGGLQGRSEAITTQMSTLADHSCATLSRWLNRITPPSGSAFSACTSPTVVVLQFWSGQKPLAWFGQPARDGGDREQQGDTAATWSATRAHMHFIATRQARPAHVQHGKGTHLRKGLGANPLTAHKRARPPADRTTCCRGTQCRRRLEDDRVEHG